MVTNDACQRAGFFVEIDYVAIENRHRCVLIRIFYEKYDNVNPAKIYIGMRIPSQCQ